MLIPAPSLQNPQTDALVLCVDDDAAILEITQAQLERKGFSVMTASDGHSAINVFRSHPIDLVILDYEMPGLKGHELALLLRDIKADVPLILHSGAWDIPEATIQVTDAVILKGSETCTLIDAIRTLIMKRSGQLIQSSRSPN